MAAIFIDLRLEAFELHRAALLLERVCQDDVVDPDLEALLAGINAISGAAMAGRPIDHSAIEQIEEVLAYTMPCVPPIDPSVAELIRYDVLAETQEILHGIDGLYPATSHAPDRIRQTASHALVIVCQARSRFAS